MTRRVCTRTDDCPHCQAAIADRENPPPPLADDWRTAQDDYEKWLWRQS